MRNRVLAIVATLGLALATPPAGASNDTPDSLRDEAFVAAQYAQITAAAAALDRVSARLAGGGAGLGNLEARRDALTADLEATERQLVRKLELGLPADPELVSRRSEKRAALEALDRQIEREFPQYFELTRPRPLSIADTQALLNPEEALMTALVLDDATYVWVVTREAARWNRADNLGTAKLQGIVDRLRDSMKVPNSRGDPIGDDAAGAPATAFDRKLAHSLYQSLLGPFDTMLAGKKVLLTNVSGPLSSLPLSLLVTAAPTGADGDPVALWSTPWLADRLALAELPAVSSLRALRCLLIARQADAHPGCKTSATSAAYAQARSLVLAGYGAPVLAGASGGSSRGAGAVYRGGLASPADLRRLPSLPFAAAELNALKAQFGDKAKIVIGSDATEAAVKQATHLRSARFVIFSTHGLLASEVGSAAEPGLVFTPPATASDLDDGLLTASEAAQLRLAADLVVLSACNTAASNGKAGAEGLSGLARAFLFAGTRSLLVSHWPVSDGATSMLMAQTFRNIEAGGDVANRAKAFQKAMKAVREESSGSFASPQYWAAFSLVGEPGK